MNIKKLALALLPIASLNATPWYQSAAEKIVATIEPYKKEAIIGGKVAGTLAAGYGILVVAAVTYAAGYKIAACYKQKAAFEKVLQSDEGKMHLKLVTKIKKHLSCRINVLIEDKKRLDEANIRSLNGIKTMSSKIEDQSNALRRRQYQDFINRYQESIKKNDKMITLIDECLSKLSSMVNINIFGKTHSEIETLQFFAQHHCCDMTDYEDIKNELLHYNLMLEQIVNDIDAHGKKFSKICQTVKEYLDTL